MATFILRIFPRALAVLHATPNDLHGGVIHVHLQVEAAIMGVKRTVSTTAIPVFPTNSLQPLMNATLSPLHYNWTLFSQFLPR
jgi:hypothetical protein